jgi:hypothetical protein
MKREGKHGHVCFFLALACTFVAAVADNITIAGNDYTAIVVLAVATALAALILVGVGWSSMSVPLRALSLAIVIMCGWTLCDAAGRRLPAVLGW